jgi:transcriptional regulator with XRE-family HTH domain
VKGKRLKELRLARGWNQQHLAFLIDIEQAYIKQHQARQVSRRFGEHPKLPKLSE